MTPNLPSPTAPAAVQSFESLTEFERKVLRKIRQLTTHRKNCMIVIRVDGNAVQIFDAAPTDRIAES